ncbi:central glycolytic genes regulator [Caldalkalibacillus uzonensis]|uniref:Central glycolytic genes regulator n=1 Tax=Caldalkalibacillus uzonensis TaxID=353224 RepID=A0ABU0CQR4_9BACI|nr:central glycolytic genes regulator [Caldalkalibacillus uzonensis]
MPDLLDVLERRHRVLKVIHSVQPVGRRTLSQLVGLTERVLRRETDFLKEQGLIAFSPAGMTLTEEGSYVVRKMEDVIREWFGLNHLEHQLKEQLGLNKVIVVAGNSLTQTWVKNDLGRAAVQQLKQWAEPHSVVSVAGGTTMEAVAQVMTPHPVLRTLLYVPARGGLGEKVEYQANTICSQMAARSGGQYRLLHVPDQLSEEAYESLLHDEQIQEIIKLVKSARIVIHGIGEANTMATRRKASPETLAKLKNKQAVAEAFGFYFDRNGNIVHKIQTVGLKLEDIKQAEHIIAVAGGQDKAPAILAFLKHGVHDCLITDEGAAREMLQYI